MKMLVTGGTGFIGSHYVNLIKNNHNVLILSRKEDSSTQTIKGDLKEGLILPKDLDWIVHFGAKTNTQNSFKNPFEFIEVNTKGTVRLLEYCKENNTSFILISTEGIYGFSKEKKNEKNKLNPGNPYAISKASADYFTSFYGNTHNLDYRIIRLTNNYGPREPSYELIPKIIKKGIKNEEFKLYAPDLKHPFLYVKDTVKGIERIRKKGKSGIYNISTDEKIKISNLAEKILSIIGKENLFKGFKEERLKDSGTYFMAWKKLKNLGWKPQYSLDGGLRETIEYFRRNLNE